MAEMYSNFEVDLDEGWVRYKFSDSEYEYIVNPKSFKRKQDSISATRAFIRGYNISKEETSRKFRELLML